MADFSAADVKRLRDLTGAGMMACKNALVEAGGDFDKAIELLRLKGAKDVGKRETRTASNGLVTALLDGTTSGVLLELACETDFVAKTESFQTLASDVAGTVATTHPADVEALLETASSKDGGKTVRQQLDEANAQMGEKIEVRRFADFDGDYVTTYLHKSNPDLAPTLGVLIQLDTDNEQLGREVAQQIAAMSPRYVTRDEVPAEAIENEKRIAEQIARDEGKPEQALPKIVEGKVNSYFKDWVLLEQASVREPKRTIKQVLDEAGVTVQRFARFKVGKD
jgi:elongation factor Ts